MEDGLYTVGIWGKTQAFSIDYIPPPCAEYVFYAEVSAQMINRCLFCTTLWGKELCFKSNPMYKIKQAKISLGIRYSLPCILWRAVSDYKDLLYSACFICHLFPIWTLWSPDLSDGARAGFMTRKAAVPLFLHTLAAHFWQEIDRISAANSWMR